MFDEAGNDIFKTTIVSGRFNQGISREWRRKMSSGTVTIYGFIDGSRLSQEWRAWREQQAAIARCLNEYLEVYSEIIIKSKLR